MLWFGGMNRKVPSRSTQGLALIMVLVVLGTLLVGGLVFCISALFYQRGEQELLEAVRARYLALGAAKHAQATMLQTHFSEEARHGRKGPGATPDFDSFQELVFPGLVPLGDPWALEPWALWGAEVFDEQGKLNFRTAPRGTQQELLRLLQGRAVEMRDYVTEFSWRPCEWAFPQTVREVRRDSATRVTKLRVDDGWCFGPDAKVRLRGPAGTAVEQLKAGWRPRGSWVEIAGVLDGWVSAQNCILEVDVRHPLNVNSASREVLAAALTGLRIRGKNNEDEVSAQEASKLADRLVGKPLDGLRALEETLTVAVAEGWLSSRDQTAVLLNAVCPTDVLLDGSGTVPFVFFSPEIFDIQARAVILASESVRGRSVIREVVELTPPRPVTWSLETQLDFERARKIPMGNKIVTFPNRAFSGEPPSQRRDAELGHLKPVTFGEIRGRNPGRTIHFPETHEGLDLKGSSAFEIPTGRGVMRIPQGDVDMRAGGLEVWLQTKKAGDFTLLDAGQREYENHLSVVYEAGELVLKVADGTLDEMVSSVRAAATLDPEKWYHVGAYWKGTKFGHLALFLDGFPVGQFRLEDSRAGTSYMGVLRQDLDANDQELSVNGLGDVAVPGVVEIGDEAIEFAERTGGALRQLVRGARGSAPKKHPADSVVSLYGYASPLAAISLDLGVGVSIRYDRITRGGARLREKLSSPNLTLTLPTVGNLSLVGTQIGGAPPPDVAVLATAPVIPIVSGGTAAFPSEGFLLLGIPGLPTAEIVSYSGKNASSFTGCQRGLLGTTASDHFGGEPVILFSIGVTDNREYLDPTIVQIEEEWIGPVRKEGTQVFTGVVLQISGNPVPIPPIRGLVSSAAEHQAGTDVLPTFALSRPFSGAGDRVTVVPRDFVQPKEQHQIRRAQSIGPIHLAAFEENVQREFVADGTIARLLQFPSGELLSELPARLALGADVVDVPGPALQGMIDEVQFYESPKNLAFGLEQSVDDVQTEIPLKTTQGMNEEGVIWMGEELIAYGGTAQKRLVDCARGYLGSKPSVHADGDRLFHMSFLPVTTLQDPVSEEDARLKIVSEDGFPEEGHALLGRDRTGEVIGYSWKRGGLEMPSFLSSKRGIFRGSFGTAPRAHPGKTFVYALPFRYFDRYAPLCADSQLAYFGAAQRISNAFWKRLWWDEDLPEERVDIRVHVRFDAKPDWESPPTNRSGGIYEFSEARGSNRIRVQADQIELRVYFLYKEDAFLDDSWKQAPVLKNLWVEYERPNVVHYHEEAEGEW